MPSSSSAVITARKAEYDRIRETPFTRVHGKPSRAQYDRLKREAQAAASKARIPVFDWAANHGIIAEVIGAVPFHQKTGIVYDEPALPAAYDPDIDGDMDDHERRVREAAWEERKVGFAQLEGAREAICENIRDALDKLYYHQLHDVLLDYPNRILDYLEHLTTRWCRMTVTLRDKLKKHYFRGWNLEEEHITAFAKRLDNEQADLAIAEVEVTDLEKRDHYVLQMLAADKFDRKEYRAYEQQDEAEKDWPATRDYFEECIEEIENYEQDAEAATNKKPRYESAAATSELNQAASDDIRRYITGLAGEREADLERRQQLASSTDKMLAIQQRMQDQVNAKDGQIAELLVQVKGLTESVLALTKQLAEARLGGGNPGGDNPGGGNPGGGNPGGWKRKRGGPNKENNKPDEKCPPCDDNRPGWLKAICNTGGYCWTHGYNPVGRAHSSSTCKNKAPGHVDSATAASRQGGSEANKPK